MNPISLSTNLTKNFDKISIDKNTILRITKNANIPKILRNNYALLCDEILNEAPDGFSLFLFRNFDKDIKNSISIPKQFDYLEEGDLIKLNVKSKNLKVLFRKSSRFNFFLVTERCDHFCLMCSQPPKNINDDYHFDDIIQSIDLIDRDCRFIGFTGGEPTLNRKRFLEVLVKLNAKLPETSILVLTNGRAFIDYEFVSDIAKIGHSDLTFAIPIYSDSPSIHDYVVQSKKAFDETVRGILNLKRYNLKVQIRVVIHKQTYERLPQLAEYIFRNLAFVDHVALMGLEITGFTKANFRDLWIDPIDYSYQLKEAALYLETMKVNVSIFNHQLCTIPKSIWHLNVKSISDWKNIYESECTTCDVKNDCGGFFSTSKGKISKGIRAQHIS